MSIQKVPDKKAKTEKKPKTLKTPDELFAQYRKDCEHCVLSMMTWADKLGKKLDSRKWKLSESDRQILADAMDKMVADAKLKLFPPIQVEGPKAVKKLLE